MNLGRAPEGVRVGTPELVDGPSLGEQSSTPNSYRGHRAAAVSDTTEGSPCPL